jgi:hypothetical protein
MSSLQPRKRNSLQSGILLLGSLPNNSTSIGTSPTNNLISTGQLQGDLQSNIQHLPSLLEKSVHNEARKRIKVDITPEERRLHYWNLTFSPLSTNECYCQDEEAKENFLSNGRLWCIICETTLLQAMNDGGSSGTIGRHRKSVGHVKALAESKKNIKSVSLDNGIKYEPSRPEILDEDETIKMEEMKSLFIGSLISEGMTPAMIVKIFGNRKYIDVFDFLDKNGMFLLMLYLL